jgi:hypothetical protein
MSNPNGNPSSLNPPWGPDNPPPISPGRPRKRPLSEAYDEWLRQPVSADQVVKMREKGMRVPEGATNADMVAIGQGRKAMTGDTAAAKEIADRVEGKPTQRIELSRMEDRTPEFVVVYDKPVLPDAKVIDIQPESPSESKPSELEQAAIGSAIVATEDGKS